ncbi:MAG: hypothetical protein ACOC8F_04520 [Planctomycetota bacterium]
MSRISANSTPAGAVAPGTDAGRDERPYDRTSWRGLSLEHPPDWELARVSGPHEPGRLTFSDRRYHRLDVKWQQLTRKPNLDGMLEKYRRRTGKQTRTDIRDLSDLPDPWHGIVRDTPDGAAVHAARFFTERRWLVEVVLVWPTGRTGQARRRARGRTASGLGACDEAVQRRILQSVQAEPPDAETRLWQAMGVSLGLGRDWDLKVSRGDVGRIRWEFARADKRGEQLVVERLAMPEYWLGGALRDWLRQQREEDYRLIREGMVAVGGHRACEVLSAAKVTPIRSLRGYKRVRRERAWQCPREDRVYHVTITHVRRDEELEFPENLNVRCCRDVPATVVEA